MARESVGSERPALDAMFRLGGVGLYAVRLPEGRFVRANARFCEITGRSEGELLARTLHDVTHPDDREDDRRALGPVIDGASDRWTREKRYVRPDGTTVHVRVHGALVREGAGRATQAVAAVEDLTETERAREAVHDRDERLRRITDAVPALVSYIDRDLRYQFNSQAYETWFGIARSDMQGRHVRDVLGERAYEDLRPHFERVLRGQRVDYEQWVPYRTGHRFIRATYMPDVDGAGAVRGMFVLVVDASEARRAEQARRESEGKFREIVEAANEGIWILDPEGRVTFVNERMAALLGCTSGELIGRHAWDFLFAEDVGPARRLWERRRAGASDRMDFRFRRTDGRELWTIMASRPLFDDRVFRGGLDLFTDVTDRRIAEDALRRSEAELREADRRKDEFLAMLAHELRNPLAPIKTAVAVGRMLGPDRPEIEWARDVIDRQTDHLSRILDDLLDVSRITLGKIRIRRERIEAASIVHGAVETVRGELERKGQGIEAELPDEPCWVDGDPVRLEQVLVNLLTNAAKYTGTAGHVVVTAAPSDDDVVFTVRDDGIGMTEDLARRVFDLFVQADTSLDRSRGGLGIGLTLVRRLVEMHGGSVAAESPGPGLGSTFSVRLPRAAPPVVPERTTGPVRPRAAERERVLVVDDNADAALLLKLLLETAGHVVETAPDGPAALRVASEFRPRVALLDIGLPGMNGYELARRLRAERAPGELLLVAVSGYGRPEDRRESKRAGFDHHLVKPVDHDVLLRLLPRAG